MVFLPRAAFFDVDETLLGVKSVVGFRRFWTIRNGGDGDDHDSATAETRGMWAAGTPRAEVNRPQTLGGWASTARPASDTATTAAIADCSPWSDTRTRSLRSIPCRPSTRHDTAGRCSPRTPVPSRRGRWADGSLRDRENAL